jgi:hypothetical protein
MTASTDNPSDLVVFDHDHGHLQKTSKNAGFQEVPVGAIEREQQDQAACKWLLANREQWKIAFLHINDPEWKRLLAGAHDGRVLVRFSSQGFHPLPPERTDPLCFRCLRKTTELRANEDANDIAILLEALRCGADIAILRDGKRTPESLSGLVSFKEPHRLRAVRIVLAALLTAIASGHHDAKQRKIAEEALKLDALAHLFPPEGFTRIRSIRRQLGLIGEQAEVEAGIQRLVKELASELGRDALAGASPLESSLSDLLADLRTVNEESEINAIKVAKCYTFLGQYLGTP